jgi:hypothetical protein
MVSKLKELVSFCKFITRKILTEFPAQIIHKTVVSNLNLASSKKNHISCHIFKKLVTKRIETH